MGKAKSLRIKQRDNNEIDFKKQHALYIADTAYVPFSTNDNEYGHFRVSRNVDHNVIDGWFYKSNGFFNAQHENIVANIRELWNMCERPWVADAGSDRHTHALDALSKLKRRVPREAWEIFENVVRWDEPTGIPGSRFSTVRPLSVYAAKHVVRFVCNELSK